MSALNASLCLVLLNLLDSLLSNISVGPFRLAEVVLGHLKIRFLWTLGRSHMTLSSTYNEPMYLNALGLKM